VAVSRGAGRGGGGVRRAPGGRAVAARSAVDGERHRRRLDAVGGQRVEAPGRLGDAFRRRNLFLLPDDAANDAALDRPETAS
jgi:hypothetical protein